MSLFAYESSKSAFTRCCETQIRAVCYQTLRKSEPWQAPKAASGHEIGYGLAVSNPLFCNCRITCKISCAIFSSRLCLSCIEVAESSNYAGSPQDIRCFVGARDCTLPQCRDPLDATYSKDGSIVTEWRSGRGAGCGQVRAD